MSVNSKSVKFKEKQNLTFISSCGSSFNLKDFKVKFVFFVLTHKGMYCEFVMICDYKKYCCLTCFTV